jgi:hypothetical protein
MEEKLGFLLVFFRQEGESRACQRSEYISCLLSSFFHEQI